MSEINQEFTVNDVNANIVVQSNDITITPEAIQLNLYATGYSTAAGSSGQLQYNNGGILGGIPTVTYIGGNLNLGSVSNIKITGGSNNQILRTDGAGNLSWTNQADPNYANFAGNVVNSSQPNITTLGTLTQLNVNGISTLGPASNVKISGGANSYFLQTDGTGNLVWAAGTANVTGNGTAAGANTQIQISDGTGNFTSAPGFTYDKGSNVFTVPGNVYIANDSATSTVVQFLPNFTTYFQSNTYHPNNSTNYPRQQTIRNRGNITNPTTAVNNDRISSRIASIYNGTIVQDVAFEHILVSNVISGSNSVYSGGEWRVFTGNPFGGNLANASDQSGLNSVRLTNSGSLQLLQGTPTTTTTSALQITNFGANSSDLARAGGITQRRARGNNQTQLSVQPNDQLGRMSYIGHNGTSYYETVAAQLRAVVDSSYIANSANIPTNMEIVACDNVGNQKVTSFYGNGNVNIQGTIFAKPLRNLNSGNLLYYNDSTGEFTYSNNDIGNANYANFAGTAFSVSGSNVSGQVANALIAGTVYTNAQPNITSVGTLTGLNVNGNIIAANITANTGRFIGNGSGLSNLTGANVTGTVANATYATSAGTATTANSANTAGTVTTNAQPNITSVGILTSLIVNGTANLITYENLKLPGGINGQFLKTDGNGNLSFATIPSGVAGSNTQVQFNNNGNLGANTNFTFNSSTITLSVNNISVSNIVSTSANLGTIGNVKIAGGTNGYFLQTDGSGNLTWAAGTGNITGNASASGANTSIQISDGTGNFTSASGFLYNSATNLLSVPGNITATGNLTTTGTTTVQQIKEKVVSNATGSTGTVNFDILSSAILLKTANATANFTINIRGNSTTTLDNIMNVNESMTCTYINRNGSTPRYANVIQIDSTTITPFWVGGAPLSGNTGYDNYTFNIVKTASNTYTVLASKIGHN